MVRCTISFVFCSTNASKSGISRRIFWYVAMTYCSAPLRIAFTVSTGTFALDCPIWTKTSELSSKIFDRFRKPSAKVRLSTSTRSGSICLNIPSTAARSASLRTNEGSTRPLAPLVLSPILPATMLPKPRRLSTTPFKTSPSNIKAISFRRSSDAFGNVDLSNAGVKIIP